MVCQLALRPRNLGACGRTRTYEGQLSPLDLQSSAFAAQPHMRSEFQISNSRFQMICDDRSDSVITDRLCDHRSGVRLQIGCAITDGALNFDLKFISC